MIVYGISNVVFSMLFNVTVKRVGFAVIATIIITVDLGSYIAQLLVPVNESNSYVVFIFAIIIGGSIGMWQTFLYGESKLLYLIHMMSSYRCNEIK